MFYEPSFKLHKKRKMRASYPITDKLLEVCLKWNWNALFSLSVSVWGSKISSVFCNLLSNPWFEKTVCKLLWLYSSMLKTLSHTSGGLDLCKTLHKRQNLISASGGLAIVVVEISIFPGLAKFLPQIWDFLGWEIGLFGPESTFVWALWWCAPLLALVRGAAVATVALYRSWF